MRHVITLIGSAALLSACGGGPPTHYTFTDAVTACESLEWADTRADLLSEGDTVEANRYASGRCFIVERARPVTIVDQQGGLFRRAGRLVLVESSDGEPLEHHAGAQFRDAIGQVAPIRGWVRKGDLVAIQ